MEEKIKISIITASYNYEDYIKETIESVLSQTYQNWEMIIVDDGSKDNSVNVIKEYCEKDSRIKLFQHENGVNKGLPETIKLGIKSAKGEWIAFVESDDTITPDYLEKKVNVISKYNDVEFIFNDINMFGEENAISEYDRYFKKQKKLLGKIKFPSNFVKLFKRNNLNPIPTFSCVMVKKDIIENIDFESPIKKALDLYIWLQLAKNKFYFIDEKLTNWRMHKSSYINAVPISEEEQQKFDYKKIKFLYGEFADVKYFLFNLKKKAESILKGSKK